MPSITNGARKICAKQKATKYTKFPFLRKTNEIRQFGRNIVSLWKSYQILFPFVDYLEF